MPVLERPSCPYCRFEIASEDAVNCDECHAAHHADCWDDNQGCAVYGCINSPKAAAGDELHPAKADALAAVTPIPAAPPEPLPTSASTPPAASSHSSVRATYFAVAGIIALAIVVAGVAIAVSISRDSAAPAATAAETSSTNTSPDEELSSAEDSSEEESSAVSDPGPEPEPEPARESSSDNAGAGSASISSAGYVAQLGSFVNRSGAVELRDQLISAGVDVSILRSNNIVEFNPGYWVVYAGPFSSRSQADAAADEANSNGADGGFLRYATPR